MEQKWTQFTKEKRHDDSKRTVKEKSFYIFLRRWLSCFLHANVSTLFPQNTTSYQALVPV